MLCDTCKTECSRNRKEVNECIWYEPQTNADRIRAMSDEDLAKVLNAFTAYFGECNRSISDVECKDCELYELCCLGENKALEWLKQPAEVEG